MEVLIDDIIVKNKIIIKKAKITIPNSGIVLFKGKNGAGKTLILKNIFEKFKKSNTAVFVDQNNDAILTKYSILENIAMSTDKRKLEEIKIKLMNFGFFDLSKLTPSKLSGGEKRIISFLRAFFSNNKIIFLDEPTNDLDYNKIEKIISLIKEDVKTKKRLFIIASHDDRICELSNLQIEIIDKELFSYENVKIIKNECIKKEKKQEKENFHFIKKGMKINLLLFFLFAFIFVFMIIRTFEEKKLVFKQTDMRNDQLDIFLSLSTVESILSDEHAISIKFIDHIEEFDFIKKYFNYKKIEAFYKEDKQGISFGLDDFVNNDEYSVYKLEFMDIVRKKGYNSLNIYLDSQDLKHYEYHVDSKDYFSQAYIFDQKKEKTHHLNQPLFLEKIKEIEETNNENIHVLAISVVFDKKMTFLIKIIKTCSSIILQTSVSTSQSSFIYLFLSEKLRTIISMIMILISIEIFYIFLYFVNNKGNIKLFKNFNFERMIVEKSIKDKLNNRILKLILLGLTLLINLTYFILFKTFLIDATFLLILVFYFSFSFYLANKIIVSNIKKIYRWDYRC